MWLQRIVCFMLHIHCFCPFYFPLESTSSELTVILHSFRGGFVYFLHLFGWTLRWKMWVSRMIRGWFSTVGFALVGGDIEEGECCRNDQTLHPNYLINEKRFAVSLFSSASFSLKANFKSSIDFGNPWFCTCYCHIHSLVCRHWSAIY